MRYSLSTWNPNRESSPWFREIDDMMDRLLVPMTSWKREDQTFNPACDVEETDSHYLMSFDLPGFSKEDIKIEVADKQLTLSGERKTEKRNDKNNRHITERFYGSFQRAFTLPATVDATKVEASYRDGVLHVALPKSEEAKPHQIKISDGKGGVFSKLIGQKEASSEREVKESNTKVS